MASTDDMVLMETGFLVGGALTSSRLTWSRLRARALKSKADTLWPAALRCRNSCKVMTSGTNTLHAVILPSTVQLDLLEVQLELVKKLEGQAQCLLASSLARNQIDCAAEPAWLAVYTASMVQACVLR